MVQSVGDFRQYHELSGKETLRFALQLLFILFTNILLKTNTLQTRKLQIHKNPRYKYFIKGIVAFSIEFLAIWLDVVKEQLKNKANEFNIQYLNAVIPISKINELFLQCCVIFLKEFHMPKKRWNNYLHKRFKNICDQYFFKQIIVIPRYEIVYSRYVQSTKWILTNQIFAAETLDLVNNTLISLNGVYTDLPNLILTQLITPNIFNQMSFLKIEETENPGNIIVDHLAKYKLTHDAYNMKNGRSIELVTLTNTSLPFMGQTVNNCDVIAAYDIEHENRTRLFHLLQTQGAASLALQLFGLGHPITNKPIHFQITKPADTTATQYLIGAGSFKAGSGHFFTTHSKEKVFKINNVAPICSTAPHVEHNWNEFIVGNWDKIYEKYIKKNYKEFADDINKHNIWMKCEENGFERLKAYIRTRTNAYGYCKSPWLFAWSIYSVGIDGLHSELNIPSIVAKYFILFGYDTYSNMSKTDEDRLTEKEILHHVLNCIKLKCNFPSGTDKSYGKIKLFGNNIRALIDDWGNLYKLIQCNECSYNPFKQKFRR